MVSLYSGVPPIALIDRDGRTAARRAYCGFPLSWTYYNHQISFTCSTVAPRRPLRTSAFLYTFSEVVRPWSELNRGLCCQRKHAVPIVHRYTGRSDCVLAASEPLGLPSFYGGSERHRRVRIRLNGPARIRSRNESARRENTLRFLLTWQAAYSYDNRRRTSEQDPTCLTRHSL